MMKIVVVKLPRFLSRIIKKVFRIG
ncbi:MAG TPA: stage V sporulation protein SpoVM [Clostridiaceae bacterium]|nr:stage V sporulation protein SpoVM [Clostridiaceae bacterium]